MIAGIPTLTTVMSSTAMNVPIIIMPSTHHLYPLPALKRVTNVFIRTVFSPGVTKKCHLCLC